MKLLAVATLTAFGLTTRAWADDILMLKGKNLKDVTVTEETFEKVTYRPAGSRGFQNVSTADVRSVTYGRESDKYSLAMDAFEAGAYKDAALYFAAAANDPPRTMAWITQYGLFNAAESLRLMRDFDAAVKAYDTLLEKVPTTRFYGDALLNKALCFEMKKDTAKAKQALEEMAAAAGQKGLGERWKLLAEYHQLRMDGSKTKLSQFDDLQQRAERAGASTVANLARLGVGNSLIGEGKFDDARGYFEEIIDDRQASPTPVVAGAYLGLGNTYVRKANPTDDDFHSALWAFARVVFYYGDELKQSEMLAEALYWNGRCFQQRKTDPDVNDKRARYMYTRVIKEFPSSTWADKAGER